MSRAGLVPPGETVILRLRPHFVYILLNSLAWLVALGVLAALALWVGTLLALPWLGWIVVVLASLAALKVLWEALQWLSRDYVLTEKRVIGVAGVIRRYRSDLPLARIQHLTMFRSLGERLTGVGTIGFATAGTGLVEMYWVMVPQPHDTLAAARDAIDRAQSRGSGAAPRIPVIGLAGGIGAGKSQAAAILRDLGCVVTDSDREAREVMRRPEVVAELVRWWGSPVLNERGEVERGRIADIVFKDAEQRRRLESFIHPLVRIRRDELRRAAESAGARAVVIDAPLLFEAGVDAECDAVLFIDAPRDVRLARVSSRGWDEAELARREAAQMPLEEKRRRSTRVISNTCSSQDLRAALADALSEIVSTPARSGKPAPRL